MIYCPKGFLLLFQIVIKAYVDKCEKKVWKNTVPKHIVFLKKYILFFLIKKKILFFARATWHVGS